MSNLPDDLGPATGEFRTWLDLAIVKGMKVELFDSAFAGNRLDYVITDPHTRYSSRVYNAQDVKNLFRSVDQINQQFARATKLGVSQT